MSPFSVFLKGKATKNGGTNGRSQHPLQTGILSYLSETLVEILQGTSLLLITLQEPEQMPAARP